MRSIPNSLYTVYMAGSYNEQHKTYATRFKVSIRTIKRWVATGAPLDDPKAMRGFIALRQNKTKNSLKESAKQGTVVIQPLKGNVPPTIEPSTQQEEPRKEPTPRDTTVKDKPIDPEKLGAANTLKRLQVAEAEAEIEYGKAKGDPVAKKLALDDWLKISEALRKFEIEVDQSQREAGEQIPREQAEDAVFMATTWMRIAFSRMLSSDTDKIKAAADQGIDHLRKIIVERYTVALKGLLPASKKATVPLEEWAIKKIREGLGV